MSGIDVAVTRHGDRLTFQVSGDLDYLNNKKVVESVRAGLRDPSIVALDLDLSQLGFCDSTGLGALIAIRSHAAERGVTLVLVEPRTELLRLLTLTGLDSAFTIHAAAAQADDGAERSA